MKENWKNIVILSKFTIAIGIITIISTFLLLDSYNSFGQVMVQYLAGIIVTVAGIILYNISRMKRDNLTHSELAAKSREDLVNSMKKQKEANKDNKK